MKDKTKVMNFCNRFFDKAEVGKGIVPTTDATTACTESKKTFDLRAAHWTRSAVILHECTHTNYAMGDLGA